MKKIIENILSFPIKVINYFSLKYKNVMYGNNLKISGRLFLHGEGKIKIGNNVTIFSKHTTNPTAGGSHTYLRTGQNGQLIIGNNVGMSHVNITALNEIVIGDNVLLGSCVKIWDTDFHSINFYDRINKDINVKTAPVHIKDGAFIGACSIILKGVTIGKHSVVGAGSVVTKDIPDGEIWAGNPAKFIKKI